MHLELSHVALALAAYHADHGSYPRDLAKLAPKYIPKVPGDRFSGKPLRYKRKGKGYLLYSVGINGVDDGGRGYDQTEDEDWDDWDDLTVRTPAEKKKVKR